MTAVTSTTMFSSSRDAVVAILKANVTDPKTGQVGSRRLWFYREFPDISSRTFSDYPLIIVSHADVSSEAVTIDQNTRDTSFIFEIQIVAQYTDTDARVDSISNEVLDALVKPATQDSLDTNNLYSPNILSSAVTITTIDRDKLIVRLMRLDLGGLFCH